MFGIFELLDQILPSTDITNHDTLRLEYLSAYNIIENNILVLFRSLCDRSVN